MLRHTVLRFTLVAAISVMTSLPVLADVSPLFDMPEPSGMQPRLQTNAQCLVGETRLGLAGTGNLVGPGVEFYQLVDVSQCPDCQFTRSLMLQDVVWRLRFASPCAITVRVSVVAAVGGAGGCYAPDPNQVLCPPAEHVLEETVSQSHATDYDMPLSTGCCIGDRAFLRVEVLSRTCTGNGISAIFNNTCTDCTQYIVAPQFLPPGIHEQCNNAFGRDYLIWSNAFCCDATPTQGTTWGRLKTIYR